MKRQLRSMMSALAALAISVAPSAVFASAQDAWRDQVKEADASVSSFEAADPGLAHFLAGAAGYAVFPSVGKGAVGVGAAYGRGVLFERGQPTGRTTLTQVTVGAQLGGQAYSELVVLESQEAVAKFKKGQLAMAAQVSAVAATAGASANARYERGVAVFTLTRGGLMAEASVGGQKFAFRPVAKPAKPDRG